MGNRFVTLPAYVEFKDGEEIIRQPIEKINGIVGQKALAALLGVHVQTIIRYHAAGLIKPKITARNGAQIFSVKEVIESLKAVGYIQSANGVTTLKEHTDRIILDE
jgi:hypothetical protein